MKSERQLVAYLLKLHALHCPDTGHDLRSELQKGKTIALQWMLNRPLNDNERAKLAQLRDENFGIG